jgi:putative glutamine amidotransferase
VQHALDAVLSTLDALVLTGGPDVDPARYGAEPHEATGRPRPARDAWEEELCRGALARDLPVLAICRGLQVLNVALGGTLHQHLPDLVGHEGHRTAPGEMSPNDVTMVAGTRLASVLGGQARGHCHHHQAIDRLGRGLVVAARAEDGTVEAAELPGPTFAVGVQWHPEDNPDDDRLFVALLQAALRARPHRGPVVPSPRGGPDR